MKKYRKERKRILEDHIDHCNYMIKYLKQKKSGIYSKKNPGYFKNQIKITQNLLKKCTI